MQEEFDNLLNDLFGSSTLKNRDIRRYEFLRELKRIIVESVSSLDEMLIVKENEIIAKKDFNKNDAIFLVYKIMNAVDLIYKRYNRSAKRTEAYEKIKEYLKKIYVHISNIN